MILVQQIRAAAAHATQHGWMETHAGYYGRPHGSTVLGQQWIDRTTWCGYDSAPLADYREPGYDGQIILPWITGLIGSPVQAFYRWLTCGGNYTAIAQVDGVWYVVAVGNRHGLDWGAVEEADLIGRPMLYVTANPHASPVDAGLFDTGHRPAEPIPRAYPWVRGANEGRPAVPDPYLHGPITEGELIEACFRGERVAA